MSAYSLIRPLLFRQDAERAHDLTLQSLGLLQKARLTGLVPGIQWSQPVKAMGLTFPNPLGLAAGLDKNGACIDAFGAMGFGFVEVGTVTPKPQPGNPQPRLFRVRESQAIINRMGFNNEGVDALCERAGARTWRGLLGVNIGKNKTTPLEEANEDYVYSLRKAYSIADYFAVNISSPNTEGLRSLQEDQALNSLLEAVCTERDACAEREGRRIPIALKIAPDMTDEMLVSLSRVVKEHGIEGVIATNTTLARPGLEGTPWENEAGGLSGQPLEPRALEVLQLLRGELPRTISLIGVGGIMTGAQAADRIKSGADIVQIYTGLIYRGPDLLKEIQEALSCISSTGA